MVAETLLLVLVLNGIGWERPWEAVKESRAPKDSTIQAVSSPQVVVHCLIKGYQATLSKAQGDVCNFEPSCSHFGEEAIRRYGVQGVLMTLDRLERCHPWAAQNPEWYRGFVEVPWRGPKLSDTPDQNVLWGKKAR